MCAEGRSDGKEPEMAREQRGRTAAQNLAWQEGKAAPTMWDLATKFGREEDCELALIELRFPGGFVCPECGHTEYCRVGGRREYRCRACNWQFSATSGTMLAHTKLPLTKWFRAIWLATTKPGSASAQAIARECGVSDVTGLSMLRRIRTSMGMAMALCKVGGDYVEADGAHVACGNSGLAARRPGSGKTDAPVLVAASSDACVIRATSDSNGTTMEEFASAHISRNHEVRCDEHGANLQLLGGWDVRARKSACDGDSEESLPTVHHIISNFKSWLAGTFHGVSVERLQEYADCFSFAYSHRRGDAFSDLLFELVRWPHQRLSEIRGCRAAMPAHEPPSEPGRSHNKKLREMWRRKQREMEQEAARDQAPEQPADDVPEELVAMLDEAFGGCAAPGPERSEGPRPSACATTWAEHSELAWEREFFGELRWA